MPRAVENIIYRPVKGQTGVLCVPKAVKPLLSSLCVLKCKTVPVTDFSSYNNTENIITVSASKDTHSHRLSDNLFKYSTGNV